MSPRLLRTNGVTRVSLGAQSFQPRLLDVLERQASPDDVRRAVHTLRESGFDNLSLDLVYGIPGQSPADLDDDLAQALALEPEHLSCYELEAKPGTRFTFAHGEELDAPGRRDGGVLRAGRRHAHGRGLPLVRDGELLPRRRARGRTRPPCTPQPRLLARARLPRARDRRRVDGVRRASAQPAEPSSVCRGARAGRDAAARARADRSRDTHERASRSSGSAWTSPSRSRTSPTRWIATRSSGLAELDLVELSANGRGEELRLTRRGRFLGGGVTAELLALGVD